MTVSNSLKGPTNAVESSVGFYASHADSSRTSPAMIDRETGIGSTTAPTAEAHFWSRLFRILPIPHPPEQLDVGV